MYYGALKGTPHKWLNLERYFKLLRPNDDTQRIRYFTAMVNGGGRADQETYLKALATTPLVEPILGKFKNKRIKCSVAACQHPDSRFFKCPEEKRTDVNIAVFMLDDAYQNDCEQIILVSGDSDLVPAVRTIRQRFPDKRVTVYVPAQHPTRGFAVELRTSAHVNRDLPLNILPHAQFPDVMADGFGGLVRKPDTW